MQYIQHPLNCSTFRSQQYLPHKLFLDIKTKEYLKEKSGSNPIPAARFCLRFTSMLDREKAAAIGEDFHISDEMPAEF